MPLIDSLIAIIIPAKIIEDTKASGAKEVVLLLEISHKERFPTEYQAIDDLKKSA
ncbi:unnamed protein product [marine sediment metagenome]|uniref:Uncharacterized protein n=1 Tax=marine sediment metagenome TaxID=412755 RepID=X1L9P6_9ZZZZ